METYVGRLCKTVKEYQGQLIREFQTLVTFINHLSLVMERRSGTRIPVPFPKPTENVWTGPVDRDNPGGKGDWENVDICDCPSNGITGDVLAADVTLVGSSLVRRFVPLPGQDNDIVFRWVGHRRCNTAGLASRQAKPILEALCRSR